MPVLPTLISSMIQIYKSDYSDKQIISPDEYKGETKDNKNEAVNNTPHVITTY